MIDNKGDPPKVKTGDGFFYKMYRTFIKNDLETIRENVVQEVIIPTITEMLVDTLTSGISMLFGVKPRRSGMTFGSRSASSYSQNFPVTLNRSNNEVKPTTAINRPIEMRSFNAASYIIQDRSLAESTLIDMIDQVNGFGFVTVGQFLDDIGLTPDQTTYNYGWASLDGVDVEDVLGGYILTLPRPIFDNARKLLRNNVERTRRL